MHPILFYVWNNFYIGTYGFLVALGVLLAFLIASLNARRLGFSPELVIDVGTISIICGFLGGRLFYILTNYGDFFKSPSDYIFSRQGFVFLGGMIVGTLVGYYYLKKREKHIWAFADAVVLSFPIGHAFGRLGCFFAGCCFGKLCPNEASIFGVRFPLVFDSKDEAIGSYAFLYQWNEGLLKSGDKWSLPVYPTQLFEVGANVLIFLLILFYQKRKRFDGQLLLIYGILYCFARFIIEFFRGDLDRGLFLGGLLSTSQIIILLTIPVFIYFWNRNKKIGITSKRDFIKGKGK